MSKTTKNLGCSLRPHVIVILVLLSLPVLGYLDYRTDPQLSLSLVYLIPVLIVGWFVGRWAGFGMVAAISLTRLIADYLDMMNHDWGVLRTHPDALVWHQANVWILYPILVYLLSALKSKGKELEKRVKERTADVRQLAAQLSRAEEVERRRVAVELHDSIGQALSALKLKLEMLAERRGGHVSREDLADPIHTLHDILVQTRTLMFNLYPSSLDDLGLLLTLRTHGEHLTSQLGVQITISEFGQPQTLLVPTLGYVYRACKELMGNAVKHGGAKEIVVAIRWQPDFLPSP